MYHLVYEDEYCKIYSKDKTDLGLLPSEIDEKHGTDSDTWEVRYK